MLETHVLQCTVEAFENPALLMFVVVEGFPETDPDVE
jgi:hypothetical protein